ncbi:hypothetical protein FB567DRAFT_178804 [Paraphoma chrysanthemicola]|uniref:Uncharacterized protein n=1 Tax=Paraphoma chrysanthemicola TaxID=798071 RepID=A0A8K0RF34_9PLEO|nr:hypothetical protein FB567DRAFT_178804 [Paraphoma chrysanthemicola]
MSSQQDTTDEALLALHEKASANLAAKLERVRLPRHIVRDLSIDDIYSGAASLHTPLVPADVQLPYIFSNHNALYANRRILPHPTTPAQLQLIRAQWFWGFDYRHNFCPANIGSRIGIRYNIMLMLLMLVHPELQTLCEPGTYDFIQCFIAAWKEDEDRSEDFAAREAFIDMWAKGPFDLIYFTKHQLAVLRDELRLMYIKLNDSLDGQELHIPLDEIDFVTVMRELHPEQIRSFSLALIRAWWRVRYIASKNTDTERKCAARETTDLEKDDCSIETMFVKLSIATPSAQDLKLVDWEDELVKGVLVDIDEDLEPRSGSTASQTSSQMPWMDKKTAMNLFAGNYRKLGLQVGDEEDAEQELEQADGFEEM